MQSLLLSAAFIQPPFSPTETTSVRVDGCFVQTWNQGK